MSGEEFAKHGSLDGGLPPIEPVDAKAPAIPAGLANFEPKTRGLITLSMHQTSTDLQRNEVRIVAEMTVPLTDVLFEGKAARSRSEALMLALKRVQEEINGGG